MIRLSPRERQVLELVMDGLGNAEIGARLGLGLSTVKLHVAGLIRKLKAKNRTQAAVAALRQGLVL